MEKFEVNGKEVILTGFENATREIAENYLTYAEEHKLNKSYDIDTVIVTKDGEEADMEIEYVQNKPKFERIRRITGNRC